MPQTIARIKKLGKTFEIIVDLDKALKFKKGEYNSSDFLETDIIFSDVKKGLKPSEKELREFFGTTDVNSIAEKIVKEGEILVTQEYRTEERNKKINQIVDYLAKNAVDPRTKHPHTSERIRAAIEQAQINIKNVPVEEQIVEIINKLSKILPLKIETKKIRIQIPAAYTGRVYGLLSSYKEKERWLDNGDLEIIALIPAGSAALSFYDKLNSATHGSALTEEIEENE